MYAHVENCHHKIEHYNDRIIMKLLDTKTPQVYSDNIHPLIIAGMSTDKAEIFRVNGYGNIANNYEDTNIFYIVCFTSVSYKLQEDV